MIPDSAPDGKQSIALPVLDFRLFFEAAAQPVLVILPDDPVFTIVAANNAYLAISGVARQDLLGRGVFQSFPGGASDLDGVPNLRSSLGRVIAKHVSDELGVHLYDVAIAGEPAGAFQERYFTALNTPVLSEEGGLQYILHSLEEATDKVLAERRERMAETNLRISENRLRQMADTSPLGLIIGDLEGRLYCLNSKILQILGYTQEDVASGLLRWDNITPPEFAELDVEAVRQLTEKGKCDPYEKVYIAKDGRRVPILIGASLLEAVKGPVEVAAFILDLTERKQSERRDSFLVQLDDATRPLLDPNQIVQTAARLLGEHLQVDRCTYCRFEADGETFDLKSDYSRSGVLGLSGRYTLTDFDINVAELFRANRPYIVNDAGTGPQAADAHTGYRQNGTCAHAVMPIQKAGKLAAAMGLHQEKPRQWTAAEIELLKAVANRCWESLERAHITGKLQESEQRRRISQRAGRIGSFEWLFKENRIIWTPELESLYGVAEGEFEGHLQDWKKRIFVEDADRVLTSIYSCLAQKGAEHTYEFRAVLPHGEPLWLRGQANFFYDEDGAPERMIGINIEIDAQKQAEAHLLQQWQLFDTALSNTPDFIYTFDAAGKFTYANRSLLSLWQRPLSEVIGKNFFDLNYPAELAQRLHSQVLEVTQSKLPLRDEASFTDLTGEAHQYGYIFVPVLSEDGSVKAVAGSTRDITDLVEAHKRVEESERRYRFLAESMPQMVWTATPDGALDYVSGPVASYFGTTREALLGAGWLSGVHDEDRNGAVDRWQHSLETGEPYEIEFRLRRASDGSWRWFLARAIPMYAHQGKPQSWVGTCTDIHEQKQSQSALLRANRELEEFAYVASHDLQEPLRMVNIYTHLILKRLGPDDAKLNQFAAFVETGVNRMEALIHDLLTFSRTVHTEDVQIGLASLSDSLYEAISVLKSRIDESRAVVTAQPLPVARGDTSQLAHVFQNLLSNALKYRKQDIPPQIDISAELEGNDWVVSVRDNGIGFDPQYASRIFGLFKRLHKDEYPGTGLGLAICRRIVERYGGRIWAEATLGEGAVFYFSLARVTELD